MLIKSLQMVRPFSFIVFMIVMMLPNPKTLIKKKNVNRIVCICVSRACGQSVSVLLLSLVFMMFWS